MWEINLYPQLYWHHPFFPEQLSTCVATFIFLSNMKLVIKFDIFYVLYKIINFLLVNHVASRNIA